MEDCIAYNGLLSEMRSLVDLLEEKYGMQIPGSPPLEDCLRGFYDLDPGNPDFQKARKLVDDLVNLNLAISSDQERLDAFLCKMR
jgi:hypothetical protein